MHKTLGALLLVLLIAPAGARAAAPDPASTSPTAPHVLPLELQLASLGTCTVSNDCNGECGPISCSSPNGDCHSGFDYVECDGERTDCDCCEAFYRCEDGSVISCSGQGDQCLQKGDCVSCDGEITCCPDPGECEAQTTCDDGTTLSCTGSDDSCTAFDACYVTCDQQVQWCPGKENTCPLPF